MNQIVPQVMVKEELYQVSSLKCHLFDTLNDHLRFGLKNKLVPLLAKFKMDHKVTLGMAKDPS